MVVDVSQLAGDFGTTLDGLWKYPKARADPTHRQMPAPFPNRDARRMEAIKEKKIWRKRRQ